MTSPMKGRAVISGIGFIWMIAAIGGGVLSRNASGESLFDFRLGLVLTMPLASMVMELATAPWHRSFAYSAIRASIETLVVGTVFVAGGLVAGTLFALQLVPWFLALNLIEAAVAFALITRRTRVADYLRPRLIPGVALVKVGAGLAVLGTGELFLYAIPLALNAAILMYREEL